MKMIWHTSSSGCVEIRIPADCIGEIHRPGDAEEACRKWIDLVDWRDATDDAITRGLRECGVWKDSDLSDTEFNRIRWLWIAAGDLGDLDPEDWDSSDPLI